MGIENGVFMWLNFMHYCKALVYNAVYLDVYVCGDKV